MYRKILGNLLSEHWDVDPTNYQTEQTAVSSELC